MTSWPVLSQSDSQPVQGAESFREFEHIAPAAGLHETNAASTREDVYF